MAHEVPIVTEALASEPESEPEVEPEPEREPLPAPEPEPPIRSETMHPVGVLTGLENAVQTGSEE